jgi:hypothetical protein
MTHPRSRLASPVGVMLQQQRRKVDQTIQFSTSSPFTRPKSFTLFVTTTAPVLRA